MPIRPVIAPPIHPVIHGPAGLQGEQGPAGLQGEQGPAGLQGEQGDTGPAGAGRDFLTVSAAEMEEYTEPEHCYIKETSLFYQYDASSTAARDGELVLNAGVTGRLIAVGGVVYDPVSGKILLSAQSVKIGTLAEFDEDLATVGLGTAPTSDTKFTVRGLGNASPSYNCDFQRSDGVSVLKGRDDGAIGGLTLDTGSQVATSVRLGDGAGINDVSAGHNVSIGYLAGNTGTTGGSRTLVGARAGQNATASTVTAFGSSAGLKGATAFGYLAGTNATSTTAVAIGGTSLYSAIGAGNTSGLGTHSGRYYGYGSEALTIITDGLFLGADTRAKENSSVNEIVIGKSAIGNGSNTTTIGNDSTTDTYLAGTLHLEDDLGVGQSTPTAKTHIKGSTSNSSTFIDKKENSNGDIVSSTRCDGQFFQGGSFVSEHRVITEDETLTNSTAIRILVLNPSTTGKVLTGPASPENWESILYNISAYDVTFARNGKEIDGTAANLTVPAGGSVHIKYFGDTIQYRTRG